MSEKSRLDVLLAGDVQSSTDVVYCQPAAGHIRPGAEQHAWQAAAGDVLTVLRTSDVVRRKTRRPDNAVIMAE